MISIHSGKWDRKEWSAVTMSSILFTVKRWLYISMNTTEIK